VAARDVGNIKFIKSLLPSLFQREDLYPSLAKRGWRDFFKFNIRIHLSLKGYINVFKTKVLTLKKWVKESELNKFSSHGIAGDEVAKGG
jgi:hypothetical protein